MWGGGNGFRADPAPPKDFVCGGCLENAPRGSGGLKSCFDVKVEIIILAYFPV